MIMHTCASVAVCTHVHRAAIYAHVCIGAARESTERLCTCVHNRRGSSAIGETLHLRHGDQDRRISATYKPLTSVLTRSMCASTRPRARISLISRLYEIGEESLSRARGVVPYENVCCGPDRKHLLLTARLRQVVPGYQQGSRSTAAPQCTGHPQDPGGSVARKAHHDLAAICRSS